MQSPGAEDIRDRPSLGHVDILALNFIRRPGAYVFRRYYRAGLRSHLMEVLRSEDAIQEKEGLLVNGLRVYPRATPVKMLRIFRRRFKALREAEEEIQRVKAVTSYLAPAHIATPAEFLAHYSGSWGWDILLAGLQEYVPGEILEPWGDLGKHHLRALGGRMGRDLGREGGSPSDAWVHAVQQSAGDFISKLRKLILETSLIPDLAGVGNLLLTPSGDIKLVDINNISRVSSDPNIPLDDYGYPVCDTSMAALIHLEQKFTGRAPQRGDPIYGPFLNPERMEKVRAVEKRFHRSIASPGYY